MKQIAILVTFLFFWCDLNSQVLWQISKDTVITYYYEDGDEFNGTYDVKDKWNSWYGWARSIASNKEQQYFSDYENHEIKDGCLNLTVTKKNINAKLVDWMNDNDSIKSNGEFIGYNKRNFKYSAGLIQGKRKYSFGYFEIKFKAPKESGLWPAFWLYGGTEDSEIDFMELNGIHQDQIHVDIHCPNKCDYIKYYYVQNRSFGGWIKLKGGLDESFNVVSGIWDENEVRFYINGEFMAVSKVKFGGVKELVANVAVPANDGPFHPAPDTNIVNFSPMVIDYIRVWTKDKSKMNEKNITTDSNNNNKMNPVSVKRANKWLYGKSKKSDNKCIFVSILKDKDGFTQVFCNGLIEKEFFNLKLKDASEKIFFEKTINENEFKIPVKANSSNVLEIGYAGKNVQYTF